MHCIQLHLLMLLQLEWLDLRDVHAHSIYVCAAVCCMHVCMLKAVVAGT